MERRATIALALGLVLACSWYAPRVTAQELSALPADALTFACTQGLPALASASPRRRVLAEGSVAAELVLACSGANGLRTLEVAAVEARGLQSLEARSARSGSVRFTRLTETARARARARRQAAGPERYDLIVLAPVHSRGEMALLSAARPRVTSETVEGLTELLAALSSEGALFGLLVGEPAALRFALTAIEALRVHGVTRPAARLVVQRAGDRYGVWVSPEPIAMDSVLRLHEHDRARRARATQQQPQGEPRWGESRWATAPPVLLHTPGAVFTERFAMTLSRHGAALPLTEPPAYTFDVAAVHDDRPLFFELTRRDRPDTWTENGAYSRGLAWLGIAFTTWLACGVLCGRAMQRVQGGGRRLCVLALLLGLLHGVTACWTAQATSRTLADAGSGVLVTLTGFAVGAALALLAASSVAARRVPYLVGLSLAWFGALAAASLVWRDVVDALVQADASAWWVAPLGASAGAACALPTWLALRACTQRNARARLIALGAVSYACAIATSCVVAAVAVLFVDFRALGIVAAATGVTATVLALRCARDADVRERA